MTQIPCFDDIISKKLSEQSPSHPFLFDGKQNGVFLQTLQGNKFIYINCFENECEVDYELIVVSLSNTGEQLVTRVKIAVFNEESYSRKCRWDKVRQIRVKLIRNENSQKYFLWQLSEFEKETRHDKVLISMIDADSLGVQEQVLFYKVNAKYSQIVKADWHPYSQCGLCILYSKQQFEVFNFMDEPELAQISINLKHVALQQKSSYKPEFTDFSFCQGDVDARDMFTIYFQTKFNTIYAAYPFVVEKTKLTETEYDSIRQNPENKASMSALRNILNECSIVRSAQQNSFQVLYPEDLTKISRAIKFQALVCHGQSQPPKIFQHERIARMWMQGVGSRKVIMQTGFNTNQGKNFMSLHLIPELFDQQQITYYPVSYFYPSEKSKIDEFAQGAIQWDEKMVLLNTSNPNLQKDSFYFCNGTCCYKIDFSNFVEILKTNDFCRLESQKPFEESLIFTLVDAEEQIKAINYVNGSIVLIRSAERSQKFDFLSMNSLKVADDIEQINRTFDKFFKEIEERRRKYRENLIKNPDSLGLTETETESFQKQTIEMMMKAIQGYTGTIKSKIDKQMVVLKATYESLQSVIRKFNKQFIQRTRMNNLLRKTQENNRKIQRMLEQKNEIRTSFDEDPAVERMKEKLLAIQKIFGAVQQKSLGISESGQAKHIQSVDRILGNLGNLKSQLDELKFEQQM